MKIRRACEKDLARVDELLLQVLTVHNNIRPDLFKANCRKYKDEELLEIFKDDNRPVFVAVDEQDETVGYAFCVFKQEIGHNVLTEIKTLYIDDLCVLEDRRGQHIGRELYEYVLDFAKASGCYNVTLNVWAGNDSAMSFYEGCGLKPQKVGMEKIL